MGKTQQAQLAKAAKRSLKRGRDAGN
jgi:hypothetical protein